MQYEIREMKKEEWNVLKEFLYLSIFVPEGELEFPRDILDKPEFQVYLENFGKKDDYALLAIADGKPVGAVWSRIMNDYGHIDDETPSLAIALLKEYRGMGIGTALLNQLLQGLKAKGYRRVSLSAQKLNYAVNMYRKAGFEVEEDKGEEYIMVCDLENMSK